MLCYEPAISSPCPSRTFYLDDEEEPTADASGNRRLRFFFFVSVRSPFNVQIVLTMRSLDFLSLQEPAYYLLLPCVFVE